MNAKVVSLLFLVLATTPAVAAPGRHFVPREHERRLGYCIASAANGRPWLEKTLWGLRDQEAGRIGLEVRNFNGSYDLGPLQVNSWWVPKLARMTDSTPDQVRWWLVHDPCFNVDVARWIFLSGLTETGNYWKAVGVYHSPKVQRQRLYASKVADRMRRRFGEGLFTRSTAAGRTALDAQDGTNLP
jgi:hypothetical protein